MAISHEILLTEEVYPTLCKAHASRTLRPSNAVYPVVLGQCLDFWLLNISMFSRYLGSCHLDSNILVQLSPDCQITTVTKVTESLPSQFFRTEFPTYRVFLYTVCYCVKYLIHFQLF
jgi:hypothetical protein